MAMHTNNFKRIPGIQQISTIAVTEIVIFPMILLPVVMIPVVRYLQAFLTGALLFTIKNIIE